MNSPVDNVGASSRRVGPARASERRPTLRLLALVAALVALTVGRGLAAEPPEPGQSIDDELLRDLNSKMSEDLGPAERKPAESGERKPTPGPGQGRGGEEPLPDKLSRELGAAAVSEADNPLVEIAQQMRLAGAFLGRAQSDERTQEVQADIVARLDKLIKQACSGGQCIPSQSKTPSVAQRKKIDQPKPSSKPSSKAGKTGGKPAKDSKAAMGKPGSGHPSTEEMISVLKQHWGELPEHAREQMLQGMGAEEFLPKYELLIEEYYKRLAEGDGR